MSEIKTACLYVRYSSANQTEQSIEGQVRVCTEYAVKHNINIVEIYADRATSASKDVNKRVEFLRMIKDSEKHPFDAVIVYKLDRFARNRYDSANFKYKLRKNGVQLISATENISEEPEGIILESVLEGMAEFYSAELAQKINRGMRESAYKHNCIGGHIPLGFKVIDKKFVINEETAPIVKEAFQLYAEGKSVANICRYFNEKGYVSSKNHPFGKSSFTKIFRNEKYLGTYSYHDLKTENAIPQIIDKETWDLVQARLKDQKPSGTYKAKVNYLLTGKLYCGHCGLRMNGSGDTGNGLYYYECYGKKNHTTKCKKKKTRKEFIEAVVVHDAMSLLTDENIELIADTAVRLNEQEIDTTTNIHTLTVKLSDIDTSLNNLMKAVESGEAPEILIKRMNTLEKEKRTLEKQLKEEEKEVVTLDKYRIIYWLEQFKYKNIENDNVKQNLINLLVNRVTVWDLGLREFKIEIVYNLSSLENKTYHLKKNGGFETLTSTLEIKSPFMIHTIIKKFNPYVPLQELLL